MVAFYMTSIKGKAVFYAAIVAEVIVAICMYLEITSYLWLNVIGCLLVMGIAWVLQLMMADDEQTISNS